MSLSSIQIEWLTPAKADELERHVESLLKGDHLDTMRGLLAFYRDDSEDDDGLSLAILDEIGDAIANATIARDRIDSAIQTLRVIRAGETA